MLVTAFRVSDGVGNELWKVVVVLRSKIALTSSPSTVLFSFHNLVEVKLSTKITSLFPQKKLCHVQCALDGRRVVVINARTHFVLINQLIRKPSVSGSFSALEKNCSNLKVALTLQLIYRFFRLKDAESLTNCHFAVSERM